MGLYYFGREDRTNLPKCQKMWRIFVERFCLLCFLAYLRPKFQQNYEAIDKFLEPDGCYRPVAKLIGAGDSMGNDQSEYQYAVGGRRLAE